MALYFGGVHCFNDFKSKVCIAIDDNNIPTGNVGGITSGHSGLMYNFFAELRIFLCLTHKSGAFLSSANYYVIGCKDHIARFFRYAFC